MRSRFWFRVTERVLLLLILMSGLQAQSELSWVWSSDPDTDTGARLRRSFEVAQPIRSATLLVSSDNGAQVYLNGERILTNEDWDKPSRMDIRRQLRRGTNVLQAEATNRGGPAGFVARLRIRYQDGSESTLITDGSWEASPTGREEWKPARVVAKYGEDPWKDPLGIDRTRPQSLAADQIQVLPGFEVELLYSVPREEEGSWVSMTVDSKGRIIACDQYGELYRVTPPKIGSQEEIQVERLPNGIGGAHGLLYAFDSLYVMVNEQRDRQGLWRLRDTNGDDQFDQEEFLRRIEGGGEHGTHAVILSPDGQSLYVVCGNHTKLPEGMEHSRAARAWDEDQIVERLWDANGHARGILAPGGYICKTDPDGKNFELISYGYRNAYDIAFNAWGDIITFDSDMEWDAGAPWYRPTRICLASSGSDLGWRSGAGKWPVYYPDSVPPIVDIGPGSPTGVASGEGARFPAKYQRAIFANDWTYGTMYAVHLEPDGAGYRAEVEEFVSGRPLPLTDLLVHPGDGALYFAIGGRRTQSGLYRVVYTGTENSAPISKPAATAEQTLRWQLEKLHERETGVEAVDAAWEHLDHPDRWIRYAARVAIERQPSSAWAGKVFQENRPLARIEASVALARVGDEGHRDTLLARLNQLPVDSLDLPAQLALLRAYQLALIRMGQPEGTVWTETVRRLDALYPASSAEMNRELAGLLVALKSPTAVAKTVPLMVTAEDAEVFYASEALFSRNIGYAKAFSQAAETRPNQQQIALAYILRTAHTGWTPALRKSFFSWFPRTTAWQGGNSLRGFIENIRKDTLATIQDEEERQAMDELSSRQTLALASPDFPAPEGPGRVYTVADAVALAEGNLKHRDFERGRAMFHATACASCHRFGGFGGGLGPDLTGSGARYTLQDLFENIIEPSKVISDQYGSEEIELKDGSVLVGRAHESGSNLVVSIDPLDPDETASVPVENVVSRKPYPISMMPPGLINSLNVDELLDLTAYIQSGGNPEDPMFEPKR